MFQASYGVEDAEYAITQLAQTTMRSEIGKMSLDSLFRERESLNIAIVGKLKKEKKLHTILYEVKHILWCQALLYTFKYWSVIL